MPKTKSNHPATKSAESGVLQATSAKVAEITMRPLRRWRLWFIGVAVLLLVLIGGTAVYAFYISTRILPHAELAGVEVGGLSRTEAKQKLEEKETAFLAKKITLSYKDKTWSLSAKELGLEFDNTSALDAVYGEGKKGDWQKQLRRFFASFVHTRNYDVPLKPLSDTAKEHLTKEVLSGIEVQPSETTLSLVPGKVEIVPGTSGEKLQYHVFDADLYKAFLSGNTQVKLVLGPFAPEVTPEQAIPAKELASAILASDWKLKAGDKILTLTAKDLGSSLLTVEVARDAHGKATGLTVSTHDAALKQKVSDFTKVANVAPTNALLKADGSNLAVTVADKPGVTLHVDNSFAKLKAAIVAGVSDHTIEADITVAQAALRADTINSLGLMQRIGTGTTDFSGSPSNRISNVRRGATLLNGKLVQDGETFSTVASLSPIDQSNGYVQGLVIVNNQTLPADGGGLCQVSTTLFRSVLNAGLPVVARANHSYQVSYYQRGGIGPGLDATIYDPNPDFKWKNDTGHAVYIQSIIKGNTLTFELYGTSDGRTAAIDGPHTLETFEPSGDPIYVNTNTLAKGVVQLIDPPVQGARTTAKYTVTRNGETINTQTFNSYYRAMPEQYLVGTRE